MISKSVLLVVAMMSMTMSVGAKTVKKSFQVGGNCEMCQARIQKAAKGVDGVVSATWNTKSKKCSVVFDDKKTSVVKIQKAIAAAGHDAGSVKATTAAYNKLPGCCKYRK